MKASLQPGLLSSARREQIATQLAMSDLVLPFWGYRKKMPMHQIVRLEGEGNYTVFHFADGTQLMVSLTLKKLESRLSPKVFVRSHKKNIINLLYLERINPDRQQLSVSLLNGDRVEVSRRKATAFMQQLRGFQKELVLLETQPEPELAVAA
ncbi:LytR/AlgR family response regulator transcription factor [Spirosoma pomorum]